MLTSTLTPSSARAFICCSVAVMGLSAALCTCGDNCEGSSVSAGVTEEVDLRGGIVILLWVGRGVLFSSRVWELSLSVLETGIEYMSH